MNEQNITGHGIHHIENCQYCREKIMSEELKRCPFCGSTNEVYGENAQTVTCENHYHDGQFIAILKNDWQNAWAHKRIEELEAKVKSLENENYWLSQDSK